MSIIKITVRVNKDDLEYLKEHPVEDVMNKRMVPYNETIRELIHVFVAELKELRANGVKT